MLKFLHNYFDDPAKLFSDLYNLNFQILQQNHSFSVTIHKIDKIFYKCHKIF